MIDELEPFYGRIDAPGAPSATPADMSPPGGAFLVGFDGRQPVCCGGVKRLADGACEIKRMYVAPPARGRGVGGRLLGALEDAARTLGYAVARLDTGPAQPHARRLYQAAGYGEIESFNGNPFASFWGEKALVPTEGALAPADPTPAPAAAAPAAAAARTNDRALET